MVKTYFAINNDLFFSEHLVENTVQNLFATVPVGVLAANIYAIGYLIHPADKIRVLLVNTLNHEEPVYLFLEGEKTYVAYRRFMLGEP